MRKCTICHESMFNNAQQCPIIYENIQTYTKLSSTMYVNVRPKTHHYDKNIVACECFTFKTFFLNRGFSDEKLRITANNRDKVRKAMTSCEFPIRNLSYLKVISGTSPLEASL